MANRLLLSRPEIIRQYTLALMREGKQRLRHILGTAISDVHITCDIWTSPNHLGILAVIAHFTSKKLQLTTVTLALIELKGKYSGLNQAKAVLGVVDDFRIRNKLGYFVMDNAISNDQLIQSIARTLNDDSIPYNP